jgi:hypothetical protein
MVGSAQLTARCANRDSHALAGLRPGECLARGVERPNHGSLREQRTHGDAKVG